MRPEDDLFAHLPDDEDDQDKVDPDQDAPGDSGNGDADHFGGLRRDRIDHWRDAKGIFRHPPPGVSGRQS